MGRIKAPAFKLQAEKVKKKKLKEFKFKAWKPLPGQLYFPGYNRNADTIARFS